MSGLDGLGWPTDDDRPMIYCHSFEGSETFVIGYHEMSDEWQGVGLTKDGHAHEQILMWTNHLIEFDYRERPLKRGEKIKVSGVELFVTGYNGPWLIAEGREIHWLLSIRPNQS